MGREDQRRAIRTLAEHVFAPTAFPTSPDFLAYLQPQRCGFDHFEENEDLRIHELQLEAQRDIFDHLLHLHVLCRITDFRMYGNEYHLDEFFADLTATVFDDDMVQEVNAMQQNVQTEYVKRLVKNLHHKKSEPERLFSTSSDQDGNDYVGQTMALHHLKQIQARIGSVFEETNAEILTHRGRLHWVIDRELVIVQTDKQH